MFEYDDEEDRNFIQRHRGLALIAVIAIIGVGVYFAARALSNTHQSAPRQDDMVMLSLPPPPPPPSTPPPTPPPLQQPTPEQQQDPQKMVEQQPVQDEKKQEAPKDKPDAPAPLGTSITGPGGSDMGLTGGLGGGGGYGDGGGGTKYGWYASEVQNRIAGALRNNPGTRGASMNIVVRIWPDSSGRITKARISGSTGDPSLDATIRDNILTGMQLSDPPPADMPVPIVMRISAQRP